MMIRSLVRNHLSSHDYIESMEVGTVAAGRIGLAVLHRLKPFDVKLHYTDRHRLLEAIEKDLNVTFRPVAASRVSVCDVVTVNALLDPETDDPFNETLIAQMKRGAYLVNTAPRKICSRDAIARALESCQFAGYETGIRLGTKRTFLDKTIQFTKACKVPGTHASVLVSIPRSVGRKSGYRRRNEPSSLPFRTVARTSRNGWYGPSVPAHLLLLDHPVRHPLHQPRAVRDDHFETRLSSQEGNRPPQLLVRLAAPCRRGSLLGVTTSPNPYRRFRFPAEVIEHAVRRYHCSCVSL
jgi:hypothetical protein